MSSVSALSLTLLYTKPFNSFCTLFPIQNCFCHSSTLHFIDGEGVKKTQLFSNNFASSFKKDRIAPFAIQLRYFFPISDFSKPICYMQPDKIGRASCRESVY